jgi:hypothetical protein
MILLLIAAIGRLGIAALGASVIAAVMMFTDIGIIEALTKFCIGFVLAGVLTMVLIAGS